MLKYKANVTVNIRSTTSAVGSTNIIGTIPAGTEFIGSGLVTAPDGVKWVDLVSAGGINKDGYISTKANITLLEDTETNPDPAPVAQFPQSYILTDHDPKSPNFGKWAEYTFSKVL
jgi:hypothetical protein